jgi:flagellin-like protein
MELRQLGDGRAVSPVIGVILMVAITVILAAVIGTFVLGIGGEITESPPNSNIDFAFDGDATAVGSPCDLTDGGTPGVLTITHEGGDTIDADRVELTTAGGTADWPDCSSTGTTISAGDSADVDVDDDGTLRVVWTAEGGGQSSTLATWNGA